MVEFTRDDNGKKVGINKAQVRMVLDAGPTKTTINLGDGTSAVTVVGDFATVFAALA